MTTHQAFNAVPRYFASTVLVWTVALFLRFVWVLFFHLSNCADVTPSNFQKPSHVEALWRTARLSWEVLSLYSSLLSWQGRCRNHDLIFVRARSQVMTPCGVGLFSLFEWFVKRNQIFVLQLEIHPKKKKQRSKKSIYNVYETGNWETRTGVVFSNKTIFRATNSLTYP